MKSTLRCAVVGTGYLGQFHCEKYMQVEGADLVAVCDRSEERAKEIGEKFGVPYFTSYRELVGEVDAVTVAADTSVHFEVASFFLSHGIHVNVEKPMAATSKEGEELARLAKKHGVKLQVGHVERFNPALLAVQERLTKPLFIECHRLAPFKPRSLNVDVVLDLMIHDLDVILSLVRSSVRSVSAVGTPVLTPSIDIANARIEFDSGTVANVTASRVSLSSTRKFRVFQANQYLSIDFGTGEVHLTTKTGGDFSKGLPLERESWSLEKGDALLMETQSFVDSICNDKPCVVTGEDGLLALQLAEEILKKIHERL